MISKYFDTSALTSSARVSIMPLIMYTASSFMKPLTPFERKMIASATMFARTISNFPSTFSVKLPQIAVKRSATPLSSAFSAAVRTAVSSMSTPVASDAPMSRAAIPRMPLPQPTSSTLSPFFMYFSHISRQSRVVSWPPVPNASPGSMLSGILPCVSTSSNQLGTIIILLPTASGEKYFFQLLRQSSSAQSSSSISCAIPSAP